MDQAEWYAKKWDDFEQLYGAEIESWKIPAMRQLYADTYQKIIGVHPERRNEFRQQLQQIVGVKDELKAANRSSQLAHANGVEDSLSPEDVFA